MVTFAKQLAVAMEYMSGKPTLTNEFTAEATLSYTEQHKSANPHSPCDFFVDWSPNLCIFKLK